MLSNVWFSIISTTTCLIFGIDSVPARSFGNGRLSGLRSAAAAVNVRAHAGSDP
jgi:hypothetical protein